MRQLRFLAFTLISFVAALFGALLSPSTWLHKALAVTLCGVLSANPALCTNNAIAAHSQEASATNPVKVETTQSHNLLAQRSSDFLDDTPPSNPQRVNNPSNRSSDFLDDTPPSNPQRVNNPAVNRNNSLNGINTSIPSNSQRTQNSASADKKLDLNGEWLFETAGGKGSSRRFCYEIPKISESMKIQQSNNQISLAVTRLGKGSYAPFLTSNKASLSGNRVEWTSDFRFFYGNISSDGTKINGFVDGIIECSLPPTPFVMTRKGSPQQNAVFDSTSFTSLDANNHEFTLTSREGGCIISANFAANAKESHFVSAKYIAKNPEICGNYSYDFEFINRYEKIVIVSSSGQKIIYDSLQKRFLADGNTQNNEYGFVSQKEKSLINSSSSFDETENSYVNKKYLVAAGIQDRYNYKSSACAIFQGLCDLLAVVDSMSAIAVIASGGIAAPVSAFIDALSIIAGWGCFLTFGGFPPSMLTILNRIGSLGFAIRLTTQMEASLKLVDRAFGSRLILIDFLGARLPALLKNICEDKKNTPQPKPTPSKEQCTPNGVTGICECNLDCGGRLWGFGCPKDQAEFRAVQAAVFARACPNGKCCK